MNKTTILTATAMLAVLGSCGDAPQKQRPMPPASELTKVSLELPSMD